MNRDALHGGPPRGPRGPGGLPPRGTALSYSPRSPADGQSPRGPPSDAPRGPSGGLPPRGSSGFSSPQSPPDAAPVKPISFKKSSVKIKGAANPAPSPAPLPIPVSAPVQGVPKKEDGYIEEKPKPKLAIVVNPPSGPKSSTPTSAKSKNESALEDLFARLNTSSQKSSPATPPASASRSSFGLDLDKFRFDDPSEPVIPTESKLPDVKAETLTPEQEVNGSSKEDNELEYISKAFDYLVSLPTEATGTVDLIKTVAIKFHRSYRPQQNLDEDEVAKIKSHYVNAIHEYLNGKGSKQVKHEFVQNALVKSEGNFLKLCVDLVDEKLLEIGNLDEVVDLCKTINTIIPEPSLSLHLLPAGSLPPSGGEAKTKPIPKVAEKKPVPKDAEKKPTPKDAEKEWKDPMDKMTAWPTQEKRQNVPGARSCLLKGVVGISSINQLQALVWGGRLEQLALPETGSSNAVVRFLTPEACENYFAATENGIEISGPGGKNILVIVEKFPGPNSVNDVIHNCIDGGASRCVRATGIDEEWTDIKLMRLARGQGQQKREVDRIKRGKDQKGRSYIEFRFSSILHSLSFKRALMDDEEWEHCAITHAPDPCAVANGVHFKDEDEVE